MVGTMMACPEGMDIEKAFLEALNHVYKWKIAGQKLELYDGSSNAIASFDAVHMK
jgi:heat shock protein HslJ